MSAEHPLDEAAYSLIARDFDLAAADHQPGLEEVHRYLTVRIGELMAQNMGRLMSILYRIDVAEHRVKAILEFSPHAEIPAHLADLVIERQLQKIRIRQHYARRAGFTDTD